MTNHGDERLVEYLRSFHDLEPDPARFEAALSTARRRVAGRRRRSRSVRAVLVASALLGGTATIGLAAGVLVNPDPRPPAELSPSTAPRDAISVLSVFRRSHDEKDSSATSRAAARSIGAPFLIHENATRFIGRTPLGESAYAIYATADPDLAPPTRRPEDAREAGVFVAVTGKFGGVGQDGPYPLPDIRKGTAFGIHEVGVADADARRALSEAPRSLRDGSYLTAVVPDGVDTLEVTFRGGGKQRFDVRQNVVIGHVDANPDQDSPSRLRWLTSDGRVLRTIELS